METVEKSSISLLKLLLLKKRERKPWMKGLLLVDSFYRSFLPVHHIENSELPSFIRLLSCVYWTEI